MATSRPALPEARNPMLEEERAPAHNILIERRCLGQTELKVKPGQVGTSNATKAENLGVLDYAHLRVPLPKDLSGSGIFLRGANRKWPEAYFLMRRSSDGFISATGMFKAAFPYAQAHEEVAEKDYVKSLDATSSEEVAGNVWIDATKALDLADEYGIRLWIAALLDPEPITHGTSDPLKAIKSPPTFRMRDAPNGIGRSPPGKRSARGARSIRSESPVKQTKTPRKIATATPRKGRKPRGATASIDESASVKDEDEINGERKSNDTVKVVVETSTNPNAMGDEVETTRVNVEMPASHPDLDIPSNTNAMLDKARAMVREAQQIESGGATSRAKGKRKAAEIEAADELDEGAIARPAKFVRVEEVALRKERMRNRAIFATVGSLVVGALIPIASSTLFGA